MQGRLAAFIPFVQLPVGATSGIGTGRRSTADGVRRYRAVAAGEGGMSVTVGAGSLVGVRGMMVRIYKHKIIYFIITYSTL